MENYKELYALSKEVFKEELERFHNLELKASYYLSVLTLLLGVSGYFMNWLLITLIPAQDRISKVLLILAVLILVSLLVAWFSVFSVLRNYKVNVIPLSPGIIEFFANNRPVDIYYNFSKKLETERAKNRLILNRKGQWLIIGYNSMRIAVICLILFGLVFSYYKWHEPKP